MDKSALPVAIVIGVDTPIGLTVIRELGGEGVPVIGVGSSKHSIGAASRFIHSFFRRPQSEPIAKWLPELIRRHDASVVLAISESDLLELAALPDSIDGCQILTPRQPQLDCVLDKSQTMAIAKSLGLDAPDSWQPKPDDDFSKMANGLSYPLAIKWNDPQAVTPLLDSLNIAFEKIEYADDVDELLAILQRYDDLKSWPMVQSYCPGVGLGQMLLMCNGHAILKFQHRRLHEWPVSGGVSTLCTNEAPDMHSEQMAKSEKLLRAINWDGPAMVEYRYDKETGRYWLMEINGRFWGSIPLAHHSGAFFAWGVYAAKMLTAKTRAETTEFKPVKACYLIPETKRLVSILRHNSARNEGTKRISALAGYIRDRLNPRMRYYVFSWRDPKPFLIDLVGIIARLRHQRN